MALDGVFGTGYFSFKIKKYRLSVFPQGLVSKAFKKNVRRCHAKKRDCCEILQGWNFDDAVEEAGFA